MEETVQGAGNVNPLALLFLMAMTLVVLGLNRRNAAGAFLATAAIIPLGQNVVIMGLHFYFLRILILIGLGRLLMRHEAANFKMTTVDKLFVGWVLVGFVCELIRGVSAESFGSVYDTAGVYFIFRVLTKNVEDVLFYLRVLAFLGVVLGACMAWEVITHRNLFYVFGGVPQITIQRGDRFRCQGSFRHPILAGTFGATLFPLLVGFWRNGGRGKWLAVAGMIGSLIITVTSASSGPLLTFLATVAGFGLWTMRAQMRFFRRGIVVAIIILALVMKAPVWFLIGKISDLTGGGGYYRSYLIDQFIRNFNQWCLIGTSYTANWAVAGIVLPNNPNMVDITNHYVAQGVRGGALGLGLFLAIIVGCFKIIGLALHGEKNLLVDRMLLWAFGVCIVAHCTAFISISYFDQINVFWFWLLAVVAIAPTWALQQTVENFEPKVPEDINGATVVNAAASD